MFNLLSPIADLLYQHDCVVVPGLGGFLARPVPASINGLEQNIWPPAKEISFNVNLTQNDGLLQQMVAAQQGITFEQAGVAIAQKVSLLKTQLQLQEKVEIPGVGTLTMNPANTILFHPLANAGSHSDSFGLPVLPLKVLTLQSKSEAIKTYVQADNKSKHETLTPRVSYARPKTKNIPYVTLAAACILVLFLSYSLYCFIEYPSLRKNAEQASLLDIKELLPGATTKEKCLPNACEVGVVLNSSADMVLNLQPSYLPDAKQSLYVVFHTSSNLDSAKVVKEQYRLEGWDARIVVKDSLYKTAIYYFARPSAKDSVLQLTKAILPSDTAWVESGFDPIKQD